MKELLGKIGVGAKRYFDKILLGVMLIALASCMLIQIGKLTKAREEVELADRDLKPKFGKELIPEVDQAKFSSNIDVDQERLWRGVYGEGSLVDPANYVYSIDGNENLLHFTTKVSPFTGVIDVLTGSAANVSKNGPDEPERDSDGDGIPDEVEENAGLNKDDPADALGDIDGDLFSNIDEYTAGTTIRGPESHPPHILRARFGRIAQTKVPIILKNITAVDEDNPDTWDISVKVKRRGGWKSRLGLRLNRQIPDTNYTIIDAELVPRQRSGIVEKIPVITIAKGDGQPIRLGKNRTATEGDPTVEIISLLKLPPVRLPVQLNSIFELEDNAGQKATYKLVRDEKQRFYGIDVKTNERTPIERFSSEEYERLKKLSAPGAGATGTRRPGGPAMQRGQIDPMMMDPAMR